MLWRKLFEDNYKRTVAIAYSGWWGTATFAGLRALDVIPIQYGSFGLLVLGVGAAASIAANRMKLAETIADVFQVGVRTGATDELIWHQQTCTVCTSATNARCEHGKRLMKLILQERHGRIEG